MRAGREEIETRWGLILAMVAAALLAFFAGRWSAPASLPPWETPPRAELPEDGPPALAAATSTAGLCPCPARRPPRKKGIASRIAKPISVEGPPAADPTAETARYLKENAARFSSCAPPQGERLRVHVEVTVAPTGTVDRFRIANLEPLPPAVTHCVEGVAAELHPPGFDSSDPEVFALTLVL